MPSSVYVETSVISYLAADPSTNIIVAGNQAITREWWQRRERFDLFISPLVENEASSGDPVKSARRLELLLGIPALEINPSVSQIAQSLLDGNLLPSKAAEDAIHIATAAAHGIDYLLTWNCRHIANAVIRPRVEAKLRDLGLAPPTICTPQELSGA